VKKILFSVFPIIFLGFIAIAQEPSGYWKTVNTSENNSDVYSLFTSALHGTVEFSPPGIAVNNKVTVRIACVGNSITNGFGISNPYPEQLQDLLNSEYGVSTTEVRNFGISGRTLLKNGDYPYWDEPAFSNAKNFLPDICIIMLGTNDTKPENWDTYGSQFLNDYIDMVNEFTAANPNIQILACYPIKVFSNPYGIRNSILVSDVIPGVLKVVNQTNALLADCYTPFSNEENLLSDGVHPTNEGAGVLATVLQNRMDELDLINTILDTKISKRATYDTNTQVTLTAIPDSGYSFTCWGNDLTGSTNPAEILMDANKNVTAGFSKLSLVNNLNDNSEKLKVSPNPFTESVLISYESNTTADVCLSVLDNCGKLIEVVFDGRMEAGKQSYKWNTEDRASGIYLISLKVNDKVVLKKIIKQ